MAFGKKGKQDTPAPATPPDVTSDDESDELSVAMFAEEPAEEEEAVTGEPAAAEPAEGSADPLGGDLLNMFQTTQIEQEDLSVVLDLAGDVDLDDLLEDLHTVAAALGCNLEQAGLTAA